jgi:hypothetical protein
MRARPLVSIALVAVAITLGFGTQNRDARAMGDNEEPNPPTKRCKNGHVVVRSANGMYPCKQCRTRYREQDVTA